MKKLESNWGIDLIGRKMWYAPWPIDINEKYRNPTDIEKVEIYGISGEAVNETLLYFEECGGDTKELIKLLNDHIINKRFIIDRKKLLDKTRWYTNEYYFYFIMFTKKVIGDYNWRFTKGEKVQLSFYHKIYEIGYLRFMPYGGEEKDVNHNILHAMIQSYKDKYDFFDFFYWANILTSKKTSINYKDVISKLENYWICSEFNCVLFEFLKIIINKDNMNTICHEIFESYDLKGFSYVPESMLIYIIKYMTKQTTRHFEIDIKYNKNNSASFVFKLKKTNLEKFNIYSILIIKDSNLIASAPRVLRQW